MFAHRSSEKELIDLGPDYYTQEEYADCMKKLFWVNKLLGFFHSTVRMIKKIPTAKTLVDIGCGDGLFLLNLSKHHPQLTCQGLDICPEAIRLAQTHLTNSSITFRLQPTQQLTLPENSFDILLLTLVCHHLSDEELIPFLKAAFFAARQVVVINDLHRHFLAYWFYKLLSPLLFRNRLITHDGLVSIKRGFIKSEWQILLKKAGIQRYQIKWCFPFRWRVLLWKE